ncbi:putative reverse transcriptase [Variovorax paradoxus B4]|uniref:Putative reverse transcriptase n=1 Tax=Variovorax paradoxus B4 TaxID=1246301 RepID=T1XLK1_VARPD|nr:putative reverse transcriptase [Variovorax paradoxus B4]
MTPFPGTAYVRTAPRWPGSSIAQFKAQVRHRTPDQSTAIGCLRAFGYRRLASWAPLGVQATRPGEIVQAHPPARDRTRLYTPIIRTFLVDTVALVEGSSASEPTYSSARSEAEDLQVEADHQGFGHRSQALGAAPSNLATGRARVDKSCQHLRCQPRTSSRVALFATEAGPGLLRFHECARRGLHARSGT